MQKPLVSKDIRQAVHKSMKKRTETKKILKEPVDNFQLFMLLKNNAQREELKAIGKILKCREFKKNDVYAREIVDKLYKSYQTPVGYLVKKPTIDKMCDRIAKKLKLRKLEGIGWEKLHSLSVNIFEKIFASMTKEEKDKLLKELWSKLTPEDKKQLKKEFNVANMASFMHDSEMMVAHIVGIHLAREMALYTAATIVRVGLGAELTLAASTILTRTATVFLGPAGWALIFVSINDLLGTDFKRVVPALLTINIINLRVHETQGMDFLKYLVKNKKA